MRMASITIMIITAWCFLLSGAEEVQAQKDMPVVIKEPEQQTAAQPGEQPAVVKQELPAIRNIEKEIIESKANDFDMIAKARALVYDRIAAGDMEGARAVFLFVAGKWPTTGTVIAFLPEERWLVRLWTGTCGEIKGDVLSQSSVMFFSEYSGTPPADLFFKKLLAHTVAKEDEFFSRIDATCKKEEDRDFTRLLYRFLGEGVPPHFFMPSALSYDKKTSEKLLKFRYLSTMTQERLNGRAEVFLSKYPLSDYEPFVRRFVFIRYVPGNYGIGGGVDLGGGVFTGRFADMFLSSFLVMPFVEFSLYKITLTLKGMMGSTSINNQFMTDNTLWVRNGSNISVSIFNITAGYSVYDSKWFRVVPHLGASFMNVGYIAKNDMNGRQNNIETLLFRPLIDLGGSADFKVWSPLDRSMYLGIRATTGYQINTSDNLGTNFKAGAYYAGLGINFFYFGSKIQE